QDPMGWITPEALRKGGISGDIDALELWNGVYDKPLPKLIAAWVEALEAGVYVPIVGNSDFHRFRSHRLGGPRNVVLCDTPELRSCLWSAVRAGRTYITDGPTLNLSVNGKTFGQQVAKAPLDVALNTFSPRAAELRLYVGRALAKTWPLQAGVQEQFRWSSAPPSTPTYLRVEIVRSLPGRDAPVFELLSNPVFVR
ncbi:MAG TPA: CehA/McbA family metallohydrolase, partial [Polyangiales bacterium]